MRETKDVWAEEGLGLLAETDGVRDTQLANTVRGERVRNRAINLRHHHRVATD